MPHVKGFVVRPWCWIVERTLGWLGRQRRLSKDYERKVQTSETLLGGVSKVEIDKNNILKINGIGVSISTSETLPSCGSPSRLPHSCKSSPINLQEDGFDTITGDNKAGSERVETGLYFYASSKSGSKPSRVDKREGARCAEKDTSSRSLLAQYAQISPTLSL